MMHSIPCEFSSILFVIPIPFCWFQNRERELEDNLQLLSQREEIEQKSRKVSELKATLQRMGLEQYDE